jgi:hypothetical protein
MTERKVVLDKDDEGIKASDALQQATARAEQAEAELARVKAQAGIRPRDTNEVGVRTNSAKSDDGDGAGVSETEDGAGETELRNDSMMAHLLDSLQDGKDIGHYGRLTFAMVARHFMPREEVLAWLTRDADFEEEAAEVMLRQVEDKDYNPPKRDRILEWQAEQAFAIIPNPDDPDCGNLYRNLKFPNKIYGHIEHYQEQKIAAE